MASDYSYLAGHELPSGVYRWRRFEDRLACEAMYASPEEGSHPVSAFVIAQRALGMNVDELFSLMGCSVQEGPLLATCTLRFPGHLRGDADYRVRGMIESVERKSGRSLGVFDLVMCRFDLYVDATDEHVATVVNTYAIPRREEGAA